MTRWSWIIIASAPEAQRALTTACTSCWCTTMSSGVKPSGRESAVRLASSSTTSSAAPRTLVVAAGAASSSAALVRPERWSSVGAFVLVSASTSFCSPSSTLAFCATRASPSMISWGRSRSARRSPPFAAWKLIANIRPAAAVTTGTRTPQEMRRRGRGTGAGSAPVACSGGSTSFITGDLARADRPRRHHCASSRPVDRAGERAIGYPCLNSEQGERSARVQRPRPQGDGVHPAPHEQGRRAQPHLVGARLHHVARPRAAVDRRLLRDRVQVPHRVHRRLEPRHRFRPAHGWVHYDHAVALSPTKPRSHPHNRRTYEGRSCHHDGAALCPHPTGRRLSTPVDSRRPALTSTAVDDGRAQPPARIGRLIHTVVPSWG